MPTDKRALYRTARATISCVLFRAGDIVAVRFDRTDWQGTDWYEITGFASPIFYPSHHLTAFCL